MRISLGLVDTYIKYSCNIIVEAGASTKKALLLSMGFGIINFLFALPAVWTIDTFGRRNLLLITFPMMALFMLLTGMAFYIPDVDSKTAVVSLGIVCSLVILNIYVA